MSPILFWPLLVLPALSYAPNLAFYAAEAMGANGYLAPFLAAAMALPGFLAIHLLARRFRGLTLVEQGVRILGPYLGRVTGAIYLAFSLTLLTMFGRDLVDMALTNLIPSTPLFMAVLILISAEAYVASRGLETISRLASFVILPALLILLALGLISLKNVAWSHLLPIASPTALDYARGGYAVLFCYYLPGAAAMVLPFLRPLRSFPRLAGISLLLLAAFFALFTAGAIGVFGPEHVRDLAWPAFEYIQVIEYHYLLLEQAGVLMVVSWLALIFIGMPFLCFTIALGTSQLTGVLDYRRFVWLVALAKVILIMLPANSAQTKEIVGHLARYGWIVFFAYPAILWLTAITTGRKESADAA